MATLPWRVTLTSRMGLTHTTSLISSQLPVPRALTCRRLSLPPPHLVRVAVRALPTVAHNLFLYLGLCSSFSFVRPRHPSPPLHPFHYRVFLSTLSLYPRLCQRASCPPCILTSSLSRSRPRTFPPVRFPARLRSLALLFQWPPRHILLASHAPPPRALGVMHRRSPPPLLPVRTSPSSPRSSSQPSGPSRR